MWDKHIWHYRHTPRSRVLPELSHTHTRTHTFIHHSVHRIYPVWHWSIRWEPFIKADRLWDVCHREQSEPLHPLTLDQGERVWTLVYPGIHHSAPWEPGPSRSQVSSCSAAAGARDMCLIMVGRAARLMCVESMSPCESFEYLQKTNCKRMSFFILISVLGLLVTWWPIRIGAGYYYFLIMPVL